MDKCYCKNRKKRTRSYNLQLKRLQCITINELAKNVITAKLKRILENEQIEIMKAQTQSSGLLTNQSGYYDFCKKSRYKRFSQMVK